MASERPTAHAEDCLQVHSLAGSWLKAHDQSFELPCTCALAERQRIFDLERRVPDVGEPERSGARVFWNSRPGTSAGQIVEAKPGEVCAPYGDVPLTPHTARWLAAALLAAADEAER